MNFDLLSNNKGRARQWSFTIPLFNDETLHRLHSLQAKVLYYVFATCEDDTGNSFIEGYINMNSRGRTPTLIRLIGYGFFEVCSTPADVDNVLLELKINPSSKEFGKRPPVQGCRKDLIAFKAAVDAGLTLEQLGVLHPRICSSYPMFVNNCLIKANRITHPSKTWKGTVHDPDHVKAVSCKRKAV
jgi:hypothetical protein